jgi:hypothetical protein
MLHLLVSSLNRLKNYWKFCLATAKQYDTSLVWVLWRVPLQATVPGWFDPRGARATGLHGQAGGTRAQTPAQPDPFPRGVCHAPGHPLLMLRINSPCRH